MSDAPVLNITMPVFNRLQSTQLALLALKRTRRDIPFSVTVVDNGSDAPLADKLREFKRDGIIDKLFLLPENMGISCACNIGWQMTDAPFYMKLDNDIVMQTRDWPEKLFKLWAHGDPLSTLGPAHTPEQLFKEEGGVNTPDGPLGICRTNLQGQAMLVPKSVSSILGLWSEDYGLYGAEDGDYGLRMCAAGFTQYYYASYDYFKDLGDDTEAVYAGRVDRAKEHRSLFSDEKGVIGFFRLNNYLFNMCIRNWKVPLRYKVVDVSEDHRVKVTEREEYAPVRETLLESRRLVDVKLRTGWEDEIFSDEFVASLKELWAGIGQSCDHNYDHNRIQTSGPES